jgi:pSer/pThr/pTyr-binding forkhead associated (FHA) protein
MIQIPATPDGYDEAHFLLLRGIDGIGSGETVKVNLGETVFAGRSRRCQYSLKKTPAYLLTEDADRDRLRQSLAFRCTSRRHCRITYLSPDVAEVENLSANGTLVDGHRVDRVLLQDVRKAAHEIRLGPRGDVLRLACGSVELVQKASAEAR